MPIDNAARISINHEYRMIAGIQSNRVGSLRADTIQIEKLFAELRCGLREKFLQRSFVMIIEESDECL